MTRFNSFKVVVKKEFKDAVRDRKSIVLNILLPMIVMPVVFLLMSAIMTGTMNEVNDTQISVVMYSEDIETGAQTVLEENAADYTYIKDEIFKTRKDGSGADIKTEILTAYKTPEEVKDALFNGDIDAVVYIPQGVKNSVETDGTNLKIRIVYRQSSMTSSLVPETVGFLLQQFQTETYNNRLESSLKPGTKPEDLIATEISKVDANANYGVKSNSASPFVTMLIPIVCVALLTAGGLSMAVDLFAGEKERNTFEPLLSTSGDRFGIMLAKFIVILTFSIGSAILQLLAIIVVFSTMPMDGIFGGSMGGSIPSLLISFVSIILMAGLFNSILLAISASSKNSKEANTKGNVLIILPMLISVCTMFVDTTGLSLWMSFVPILNTVLSLKIALSGVSAGLFMGISILMNAIYLVAAMFYSLKIFSKEKLISRS